jgi:mRNA interferase HicA
MKRHEFLRHLRVNGCILKREGAKHSLYMNPINGVVETVPRHVEIDNRMARKI